MAILNITVAEFNRTYKGQYSIVKGEGLIWKGFWLVMDKSNEQCGVLVLNGSELTETLHSKGNNNILHTIKQKNNTTDLIYKR